MPKAMTHCCDGWVDPHCRPRCFPKKCFWHNLQHIHLSGTLHILVYRAHTGAVNLHPKTKSTPKDARPNATAVTTVTKISEALENGHQPPRRRRNPNDITPICGDDGVFLPPCVSAQHERFRSYSCRFHAGDFDTFPWKDIQ